MAKDKIKIRGARVHNLKNISLEIPRDKLVVMTGLSGSGKSSLAFDTIFAEGQRRYIESLSAYARQFLAKIDKPDVDEIDGLSPSISIDQKSHSNNPRSTVATITEIYDYLRILFARLGEPHCPLCGHKIKKLTKDEIVEILGEEFSNSKRSNFLILAPIMRNQENNHYQRLYDLLSSGFYEARINGEMKSLRERIDIAKDKIHKIELVIDRLPSGVDYKDKEYRSRLVEAVETALKYGDDTMIIVADTEQSFSAKSTCPNDGFAFPEIEPRLFSFNSPFGACKECGGLGTENTISEHNCKVCLGKRLNVEALNVLVESQNITHITAMSIEKAREFFLNYELNLFKAQETKENDNRFKIAENILKEILARLRFLFDVGLEYLTLDRRAGTLSGGEAQRIRLASQIGSSLTGTLYILDEPTIGLHQRDNEKLIATLKSLRDLGNTVIVVEHDEDTIRASDFLVDIGPLAGVNGGNVVAIGEMPELLKSDQKSLTLDYLRGVEFIEWPKKRRKIEKDHPMIKIRGASENNLKDVNVEIPTARFVAVTGVSGSGKSTLVNDVLYKFIANKFNGANHKVGKVDAILGLDHINRVIEIDQSPIGRTPRSNPATYVGAWTYIRDLFASTPEAKIRGYLPGRFSFNVPGGRCGNCDGYGTLEIEMHFLPSVEVECEVCRGKRFDHETLKIKYKGKNIYEVLEMSVAMASEFFDDIPWLKDRLQILEEVGLEYLKLGQSATTLSGGEAQRIKLASELGKRDTRKSLYILDEPTTGLHFADIKKLLEVLERLVERGNTILVIEHNLDVIKSADWVIDLGPEGGIKGGEVVAFGTPEDICRKGASLTGQYLKKIKPKN